jgi:hypothetical protein
MSQRSRLLIYERKEVVLLGILTLLVAVFAFTFGIHLGKRVPPRTKPATTDGSSVGHVSQISDQTPTRAEAQEKVAEANAATGQILDQELKGEVGTSGLQLEKPVQIELPKKTIAEKRAAAAKPAEKNQAAPHAESAPVSGGSSAGLESALARSAPVGLFTVQVLSAPAAEAESLNKALARFSSAGLHPWARRAEIPGKGSWIRLYLGGFATRESAEMSASGWKSAGKVDGYVVGKVPEEAPRSVPVKTAQPEMPASDEAAPSAEKAVAKELQTDAGQHSSPAPEHAAPAGEHHE